MTTTTTSGVMTVNNNDIFVGTIVSQGLHKAKSGSTFLKLVAKLTGRLLEPKRAQNSPIEQCPPGHFEQEETVVWIGDSDKEIENMAKAFNALGFEGDLATLEPNHPQHAAQGNLVGRKVYFRKWIKEDGKEVWQLNTWRPLPPLPAASSDELKTINRSVAGKLKAAQAAQRAPKEAAVAEAQY